MHGTHIKKASGPIKNSDGPEARQGGVNTCLRNTIALARQRVVRGLGWLRCRHLRVWKFHEECQPKTFRRILEYFAR
jgi:hypothetical protein